MTEDEYRELIRALRIVTSILYSLIRREITPIKAEALIESLMTGVNCG